MSTFETLLKNPEQITFAFLFVFLLVWVIKTNQEREKDMKNTNEARETRYREREDNIQKINNDREERYQDTINGLTQSLKGYEDIKKTVDEINRKLH